ncbi:MAG: OmpA family protein [Methylobacter sp.]|nr:OmpA family protein [Methylobacter sp.]
MNQQHSLDHDGLDGILQSSGKPQSKNFYFRFFLLISILIIITITAFWLQKNLQMPLPPSSAMPENLPDSSKNESPSTQQVSPPRPNPAETTLSDSIPINQLPAAPENQVPQAWEPARAETATLKKPPVIELVPAATLHQDNFAKPLMANSFKVNFKLASSDVDLSKTEKTNLTHFAEKCNNQIQITGHTCNLGSAEHNQTLGWARADAIKKLLIRNGVPGERIITASKGMQNPIASNETKSGRALNRRAELSCIGKSS